MLSEVFGERASVAMGEFYRMRAKYREHKTKRGLERVKAKSKKVTELLRKTFAQEKKEPKWA